MKSPNDLGRIMGKNISIKKENIIAFISSSDLSEEEKWEQLSSQLTLDLLTGPYIFNRTLFHYLIGHNVPFLLKKIITQNSAYKDCALQSDRFGKTLLHYVAAKDEDHTAFLQLILKLMPELINNTDEQGDTALDFAISHKITWAIRAIIDLKYQFLQLCDINLKIKPQNRSYFLSDSKYKNLSMDTGLDVLRIFPADFTLKPATSRGRNTLFSSFPHLFVRHASTHKLKLSIADSPKSTNSSPKSDSCSPAKLRFSLSDPLRESVGYERSARRRSVSLAGTLRSKVSLSKNNESISDTKTLSNDSVFQELLTKTGTTVAYSSEEKRSGDLVRHLLASDFSILKQYLQSGQDPDVVNNLGRPLLIQSFLQIISVYFAGGEVARQEDAQEKFNAIITYANLENRVKGGKKLSEYFNGRRVKDREIIRLASISLHQNLQNLRVELAFNLDHKSSAIDKSLYDKGLVEVYRKRVQKPDFAQIAFSGLTDSELAEDLWNLCTSYNEKQERYFDKKELNKRALGLQGLISAKNIFHLLTKLYPYFDRYQKLIASFVVKETLLTINSQKELTECITELRSFLEMNVSVSSGLGNDGIKFNELMGRLVALKFEFLTHPVVVNHEKLNSWLIHEPELQVKQAHSFDHLVKAALSKASVERKAELKQIAAELKTLSLYFYRHVSLKEFERGAWLKEEKNTTSSHIVLTTRFFNHLSDYFALLVLSQRQDNFVNIFKFLAELSCELCGSDEGIGPDMNSLMALSGALNNSAVSRLITHHMEPKQQEYLVIQELRNLVDQKDNFKLMRMVSTVFSGTIPFLGQFLTDLTMSVESNQKLNAADIIASAFTIISNTKELSQSQPLIFTTDVFSFFNNVFNSPEEDDLYHTSLRIQPSRNDVINLDLVKDHQALCTQLSLDYIKASVVPGLIWKDMSYPPEKTPQILMYWILAKRKEQQIDIAVLKTFEGLLDEFRIILKKYYDVNINPVFYKSRLFPEHFIVTAYQLTRGEAGYSPTQF